MATWVDGDPASALPGRDAVLICVGTPLGPDGEADLTQVERACRELARHAATSTVVLRSTLPLGSTGALAPWLHRTSLDRLVTNPEFLRQGTAIADFLQPTRVVIGTADGADTAAALLVKELSSFSGALTIVTDYASAEMIKNAANAFLATKLSFTTRSQTCARRLVPTSRR